MLPYSKVLKISARTLRQASIMRLSTQPFELTLHRADAALAGAQRAVSAVSA